MLAAVVLLGREPVVQGQAGAVHPGLAAVEAVVLHMGSGIDGLALIDREHRTICLYQYQPRRPEHERFVLVAARSFRYDCQLEDFNTAEPRPAAVRELLERARGPIQGEAKPEALKEPKGGAD